MEATTAFMAGIVLSGVVASMIYKRKQCEIANQIARACCEKAFLLVSYKNCLVTKTEDLDPNDIHYGDKLKDKLYPIDTDEFKIVLVPKENQQSGVHISEFIGVYSKRHGIWLMIEESTIFTDDGMRDTYKYYLCDENFNNKDILRNYRFKNVKKYVNSF